MNPALIRQSQCKREIAGTAKEINPGIDEEAARRRVASM